MKKFILRLVSLTAVFSLLLPLVGCGGSSDNDNSSDDTPALHESYIQALSIPCTASEMTSSIVSKYETLTASYTAAYTNDAVSVTFKKQTMGVIDENTTEDDLVKEETGSATINPDGSSDGKLGALAVSLFLRRISLTGVTEYEDTGSELTFKVKSADSKNVFGCECEYDVDVKISLTDGRINKIYLSYEAKSGNVTAECKYTY